MEEVFVLGRGRASSAATSGSDGCELLLRLDIDVRALAAVLTRSPLALLPVPVRTPLGHQTTMPDEPAKSKPG